MTTGPRSAKPGARSRTRHTSALASPTTRAEDPHPAPLAEELLHLVWTRMESTDEVSLLRAARLRMLDTVGVMAAATRDSSSESLLSEAGRWPSACHAGATALTLGPQHDPATAALVNGFLANCIDFDDTYQAVDFRTSGGGP